MLHFSIGTARRSPLFVLAVALLILGVGYRELRSAALAGIWASEFRGFERRDQASPAPRGVIVFTGASSIAYWDTLASDMKPLKVLNRAFPGAEYSDVIPNIDRLVITYHPGAVVVYAGDNDLATPTRKTPQSVTNDVKTFVDLVHAKLPDTWVYVMSIKPSHARWDSWPKMKEADGLIQEYLRTQDRAQYIDVASSMIEPNGNLPNDLFISDGLHPSAKCYALWTSIIKPVLMQRFGPAVKSSLPLAPAAPAVASR